MNQNITMFIARAIVLLTTLPVHESAHGLVSYWLGDPTAKAQGRITLNPLRHLDPIGSAMLLFVGFGWAKPVPVDARYYKNPKLGMALTAAAGPLSNLLMATLALIIYKTVFYATMGAVNAFVLLVLETMVFTNIVLGMFNLLPCPPFDGSRIFLFFLPDKWYFGVMKYERYIMGVVFVLLFFDVLDKPLQFLYTNCYHALDVLTRFVDYFAIKLIG